MYLDQNQEDGPHSHQKRAMLALFLSVMDLLFIHMSMYHLYA